DGNATNQRSARSRIAVTRPILRDPPVIRTVLGLGGTSARAEDTIPTMQAKRITPILNVSDIRESFAWFEKLGWQKGWDWGEPPTFGGVCSGDCEIFLCEDG